MNFYPTNSSVLSLQIDKNNNTFLGCIGEFGCVILKDNRYQYEPLLANDSISDHFTQTIIHNKLIYFLSNRSMYVFDPTSEEVKLIGSGNYVNAYEFQNELIVNSEDSVYKVEGTSLIDFENGVIKWRAIKSSQSGSHTYGLDLGGGLYKLKEGKPTLLSQNQKLIDAGIDITNISWVNDSLLACSTINAGVLFFNANDPKYFKVVDYYSGLPDNEIHDLYTDRIGGVWVIHNLGLTRIAPLFPANNYSNFPTLEGNLNQAKRINNELWVTTSAGVYFFKEDTSFREKVIKSPITSKASKGVQKNKASQKGLLSGLFKKKNQNRTKKPSKSKTGGFLKRVFSGAKKEESDDQRQIQKILTGVSYEFVKVPDTEEKFDQLISFRNQVLATSYSGVYTIKKGSAELSIPESARLAYAVPNTNHLFLITEEGMIKIYAYQSKKWTLLSTHSSTDVILNIFSDKGGRIWLAGTSSIQQITASDEGYTLSPEIKINNRYFDRLGFWESDEKLYLISSEGIFGLDEKSGTISLDTQLLEEIGKPQKYIQDQQSVWIYNGKMWHLLTEKGTIEKHQYMGVFQDLVAVSLDEKNENTWLITGDNQLISFTIKNDSVQAPYPLFIKRLSGKNGEIGIKDQLLFSHDENHLNIQLLKPDYMGALNFEYQYKLKGLHAEWSNWTHSSLIDYSFIPPGNYELLVRARGTFGDFEEASMLQFEVKAPYWQQSWFYLVQVLILSLIIIITSKLNQEKQANQMLKSALRILTLVVIIEFLQSVMSAYIGIESTPVVGFLIDVSTAILVFPLEWVLRKVMIEGSVLLLKKKETVS